MLPRRPILIMSPSASAEVGSPTTQASSTSPRCRSHSSTFFVPLTATPSSSPVINRLIEPAKPVPRAARNRSAAAMKAAIAPFMSTAPRPHNSPSRRLAANGSNDQPSTGPVGTTSVCPAKHRLGRPLAEAGVEIGDRRGFLAVGAGIVEDETVAGKAEPFEPARDDVERALVLRRDARPPDQLGGEFDRVDRGHNARR